MAKKKVFGIRKGINPKTGETVSNVVIEATWDVVKEYVTGVKGAEYKGFSTIEEAENYVNYSQGETNQFDRTNTALEHKKDVLYCYVDGSFNKDVPNYGFGLVCVMNGKVIHFEYGEGNNNKAVEMRQIGGELLGAMKALLYARKNGYKNIVIYHDYKGVANHATGTWARKTEFSKIYYEWMQNFFENHPEIKVGFQKVDAHTGDDFNELADGYAKISVGLKPNNIFYKMAEKHKVQSK